jgi:hypothetical protein
MHAHLPRCSARHGLRDRKDRWEALVVAPDGAVGIINRNAAERANTNGRTDPAVATFTLGKSRLLPRLISGEHGQMRHPVHGHKAPVVKTYVRQLHNFGSRSDLCF